jgi:Zn-dependent alcohol dehydrogenase
VRAAVLRAPGGPLQVEDVDLGPPHAGELLVRVEAGGVCHTELHYMSGDIPCPLPIVLGHEGTGVVEEVGAGVEDFAPGQRVAFTWRPRCGHCEYCVTGRPVMCVYGRVQARSGGLMDGTSRLRRGDEEIHHFLGVSCFAEYAVVSCRAVVAIPADIPAEIAAIAGCAVVTGVGAVVNVAAGQGSVAGRPMLVLGAGGVGLSAVMGAHLVGAAPVVVVDVARDKLDLAQRLGATDVVDATQVPPDDLVATLQSLTAGGAEVAIDAVGSSSTMAQAFAALRPGGTVIAVGLSSASATVAVPINELVQQQKHLVGCLYGSANPSLDLPRLLGLYRNGRLPLDKLLGATYSLDEVGQAYDQLRAGAVGRAIVVPAGPVAGTAPVPVPVPAEVPAPHRP